MKQRIIGAALSLSVLCQLTAGALPALPAHAAAQHSAVSFETFAALVQETVSADADKDLFQEIVYDPANGTLSQDGGAAKTDLLTRLRLFFQRLLKLIREMYSFLLG